MKLFETIISVTFFTLFLVSSTASNGQITKGHIPFYAEPYYNYNPLKIAIGKYKKELLTNDTTELISLASKIKADINNTDVESLYFLSIRLYDLGKKDDAFYWFQTAKSRARIFMNTLDPKKIGNIGDETFELKQFFVTCNQLVGEYLNGYGLNDIEKGITVFEKVKNEIKNIQSFKDVYPNIQFLDDKTVEKEKANKEAELEKTIDYIKTHKEEIKRQRIENGIQDKY
ncbi:MAG: hypothetical protein EAZ97_15975 [Bacteroidetes bacterium]|nr:MAG: hypothetical protein EAZ97_15975 [Bacteroidota bacterium]